MFCAMIALRRKHALIVGTFGAGNVNQVSDATQIIVVKIYVRNVFPVEAES